MRQPYSRKTELEFFIPICLTYSGTNSVKPARPMSPRNSTAPGARAGRLISGGRGSPAARAPAGVTVSRVHRPMAAATNASPADTIHTRSKWSFASITLPSSGPKASPPYTATDQ